VHLVGFTIGIYYDARNYERQKTHIILIIFNTDTFSHQSQFNIVIVKSYLQPTQKTSTATLKLLITCEIFIILNLSNKVVSEYALKKVQPNYDEFEFNYQQLKVYASDITLQNCT
jgi:hypothetical protein